MTLSAALQNIEAPPAQYENGQNGDSGGYSPERIHPLMLNQQADPGKYDSYLATVRHMVNPEMRTLSDYVRGGYYATDTLRDLAHRYYHLTQWQIRSESSMLNHRRLELLREKAWLDSLLLGLKQTTDVADLADLPDPRRQALMGTGIAYSASTLKDDGNRPLTAIMPVTLGEAYERITEITSLVQSLALRIRRAQQLGIYYDVGPLLAYWSQPYEQRGDLDPTLGPGFMMRLNDVIDISSAAVWRRQARGIISQTAEDAGGKDRLEPASGDEQPKGKRSILGRIIRK